MSQNNLKQKAILVALLLLLLGVIYIFQVFLDIAERKGREAAESNEITVTIPEGFNLRQIGERLETLGFFSQSEFVAAAAKEEGYLFPDTYRFYKKSRPEDIVAKMKENFSKKITPEILAEILRQKKTLQDVIIMASLLEEEVKGTEDRKLVAGILWKRLKLGMGLQVDSAPDTYRYRGLPPDPISNPGLDAILAAVNPAPSPYLYYLSGRDGKTHYAETLEGHALNKFKYLK